MADWGSVPGGTEPWRKWGGCRERLQPPGRLREPGGVRAGRRTRYCGARPLAGCTGAGGGENLVRSLAGHAELSLSLPPALGDGPAARRVGGPTANPAARWTEGR